MTINEWTCPHGCGGAYTGPGHVEVHVRGCPGDTVSTNPELLLHRAAEWRRQFVADHGVGYDDDPTFRLIRDLAQALQAATKNDVE